MSARRVVAIVGAAAVLVAGAGATWLATGRPGLSESTPASTVPVTISSPVLQNAPPSDLPTLAWGPTVVDVARAQVAASQLPLDVAAGHVIVAYWNSPDSAGAAAVVRDSHVAGVILMSGAVVDSAQVRQVTEAVAQAAQEDGREWPPVISTDQEGGPVARLDGILPEMPAFMAAGAASDKATVTHAYEAVARDMADLGFTVNWAPVADVTVGPGDPVIQVRSAGSDPDNVAATVVAAVEGFMAGGVAPAVKHFPGHGSVTTDSHAALPVQTATVEELSARDFVPFTRAVDEGAPMVMMGHISVAEWGGGPATTNPEAYAYLREELGFTGVAATDALNMAAISDVYGPGDSEVAALAAGADLLLLPRDVEAARQAIVVAVENGSLSRQRLDEAVARVSLLMTQQAQWADAAAGQSTDVDYARQFAATSATVVAPQCGEPLVGDTVRIVGGWPGERRALADALAAYGVGESEEGTTVRILGSSTGSGNADVVVAMDGPWGLPASQATAYVGLYGRSEAALAGLADVLTGNVPPGGSWPVPGMPGTPCGR
ncbi:beta-N-acetylhexosaminidase [Demequina sp. TTPB684]|uniref:glycoside hydrolase family 3 N-terminal domain-containing protein n=1 Tax=unclassified Demequina TaxID=2620311 RepID=UPI001CF0EE5F|nr:MULTISPECIES: glycoside hydrolase family 3 N-terminal domain-containing protein [unclassified Demequina]MCB2412930.1 beta-N-acetylhexosaminidase [Demequina sp. TTPB684]UPU88442.1 beta-N-acetylhexosaminidase [Demequina sp. TMPB413]